jgi:hypothetical protein
MHAATLQAAQAFAFKLAQRHLDLGARAWRFHRLIHPQLAQRALRALGEPASARSHPIYGPRKEQSKPYNNEKSEERSRGRSVRAGLRAGVREQVGR